MSSKSDKFYINASNLPPRLPITGGIAWALGLDRIHAPGWVWGAIGLVWLIVFISEAWRMRTSKAVDVLEMIR